MRVPFRAAILLTSLGLGFWGALHAQTSGANLPPPTQATIAGFEDPSQWRADAGAFVHRGAGFLAYRLPPNGVFTFTVELLSTSPGARLRWCLNRIYDNNFALFEMDGRTFLSRVMTNGKLYERTRSPLNLANQKQFTIQIDIAPQHILHRMFVGDRWINLDSWAEPGRNFSQGKFGFLLQSNDEIRLTAFQFQPQ